MEFRLANLNDLPALQEMYRLIVQDMRKQRLQIWDNVYPCEFLKDDIIRQQMYLLADGREIIAAFSLCKTNDGENHVAWMNPRGKAVYLERFGVNSRCKRQGFGSLALEKAKETARTQGFEYLRLFVADSNAPAIYFYEKTGFSLASGCYDEVFADGCLALREYGYEIAV